MTKKEVRNIQCEFFSETLTQQVGRIHRLLAEPTVCVRLGQCVEAVGKQAVKAKYGRLAEVEMVGREPTSGLHVEQA